jgi:hypothetical protein
MTLKIKTIILCFWWLCPLAYAELPTAHEVSVAVDQIWTDHETQLLWMVQQSDRPGYEDVTDPAMMNQLTLCRTISEFLAKYFIEEGYDIWLNRAQGHVTIGMMAQEKDGEPYELIIDPTWRQVFVMPMVFGVEEDVRYTAGALNEIFKIMNLPGILVMPKEALRQGYDKVERELQLSPIWSVKDRYFNRKEKRYGAKTFGSYAYQMQFAQIYTFDYYYKTIKRIERDEILAKAGREYITAYPIIGIDLLKKLIHRHHQLTKWQIQEMVLKKRMPLCLYSLEWANNYFFKLDQRGLISHYTKAQILGMLGE